MYMNNVLNTFLRVYMDIPIYTYTVTQKEEIGLDNPNNQRHNQNHTGTPDEPKNQQNVVVNQPKHETERKSGKGWLLGVVAVLGMVLIAGFFFFSNGNDGGAALEAGQEQVQEESDVNVDAPDVNVETPDIDTEGIEQSIENGIKEGAEAVTGNE